MDRKTYDVAILGLGPVGCLAAILLARAGLSVVAVERDGAVYRLPRAVNLDGEIVRALQPIGLSDKVAALLQPAREGERAGFANSRREFLFGQPVKPYGANGWQSVNMFDQPELEAFLRQTALGEGNVTGYVGFEATDFDDTDAGVTLTASRHDQQERLAARYLIACDGASSFTRRRLDIPWRNLGYDHDWLVVDVVALPGNTLGHETLQVCDPDRIVTYVATKDPYRRWEFKLNDGETWEEMLEPEKIRSLIETWTPTGTYEIRRAAMYQFHAATADTWRVGNVFIAGDAAHQTPPFLGQGMNAGMRDVINLSWKLALVTRGLADGALLDSYESERKAHAHDLVEWAVSVGRLMEHLAAVEAAARDAQVPPDTPPALRASGYGQGREQPPLRAGVIMADQVGADSAVGCLLSQPTVQSAGGTQRLDDLLGGGFAVIGRTAADLKMSAASRTVVERLGIRLVSLEGLHERRGRLDRDFERTPALIVRPDRYVFGHVDANHSLDDLILNLSRLLCLQPHGTQEPVEKTS